MGFIDELVEAFVEGLLRGALLAYLGEREETCARCGKSIRYNVKKNGNGPFICSRCNEIQERELMEEVETSSLSYTMPGMGQTIGQMGGYKGKFYGRKVGGTWVFHCIVFFSDGTHISWDFDPMTGDVSRLHGRPDDLNQLR